MSDALVIQSHVGPYRADFDRDGIAKLEAGAGDAGVHVLIDDHVAKLYAHRLGKVLDGRSVLRIVANEGNKSLERFPAYVESLVSAGVRRDHHLVAIGGGVIQDITCFLAATLLRGIEWRFYPTTLLAQADSCIGSKSSVNCGAAKNILGTFTPPAQVVIDTSFLRTLEERDLRSGVGEMLKVHAIAGDEAFDAIAARYDDLFVDDGCMNHFIRRSLEIKQGYIERDEFDRGPRLVFNYGHSFGHAIEAATDFAIPHGIAVTLGMDMANFLAWRLDRAPESLFRHRHEVLARNYRGTDQVDIPLEPFLAALSKDKKNVGSGSATVILPNQQAAIERVVVAVDPVFIALCREYLEQIRR